MSFLNPTPRFPSYTGPFNVGTTEYEFATADLDSPTPCPDTTITTVQFRVFYPTDQALSASKPLGWLPEPQRESLSALGRFLGASHFLAEVFSYLPTLVTRITIPAAQNAPLKAAPQMSGRWPLMIFSHGLGGSRNTYSHLLASMASHGIVVVAAEHRDGSAPQTRIQDPSSGLRRIEYNRFPHVRSPEVEKGRNDQLRIRLWELGLIHDAVSRLDKGKGPKNWVPSAGKSAVNPPNFKSSLDMHEPGRITWAGHSFGAATMVQFVKSVFWDPSSHANASESLSDFEPLFRYSPKIALASQITPSSPLVLLDLWTLPLRGQSTLWLWERSLPCYTKPDGNMSNVLAVLSEEFFVWHRNFKPTTRVLSANPSEEEPVSIEHQNGPRIFYPLRSAHLSQSDFAVLFPWITKKWMGADEPERTLRLNVRAILQMLRENGIPVQDTHKIDAEEEKEEEAADINLEKDEGVGAYDWNIMAKDGGIRGWVSVSMSEIGGTDMKEKL